MVAIYELIILCCRACPTCVELRMNMKDNGILHREDAKTKARKRKAHKAAEKALMKHLNDSSIGEGTHALFDVEKVFPPEGRYVWENGGYVDTEEVKIEESEKLLIEALAEQRKDFREGHYVAVSVLLQRDGNGRHARPEEIKVGHIVIFKVEGMEEGKLPWCVGEVIGRTENMLSVCQYGCEERNKTQQTKNIKWGAHFQGTEYRLHPEVRTVKKGKRQKVSKQYDEFHLNAAAKSTSKNMKPVMLEMSVEAVAEYDDPDKMFKTVTQAVLRKKAKGRDLRKWVLDVLSDMTNLAWTNGSFADVKM
jgi:hypothetical protein